MPKLVSLLAALAACSPAVPAARPAPATPVVSPIREPRADYDVYRGCPAATAVVRATGRRPADTRGAVLALLGADLAAAPSGGRPCVRARVETGFVEISRPDELEPALAAIGAWMVREDVRGEVDVSYDGPVELR